MTCLTLRDIHEKFPASAKNAYATAIHLGAVGAAFANPQTKNKTPHATRGKRQRTAPNRDGEHTTIRNPALLSFTRTLEFLCPSLQQNCRRSSTVHINVARRSFHLVCACCCFSQTILQKKTFHRLTTCSLRSNHLHIDCKATWRTLELGRWLLLHTTRRSTTGLTKGTTEKQQPPATAVHRGDPTL